MPEFLSPELNALRDRVAEVAVGPLARLRDDPALDDRQRAAQVRAVSQATGLYGLTQDEATSALTLLVVRDTLSRHAVGHLDGLFGAEAGVLAGAAQPLRDAYLLPLLAGEKRGGFAFTEPSDVARRTWARVDGDRLVITGQKSYVTGGADADFLTALVDIDGQGPAMVIIDTDAPGVVMTRRFTSLDGSHHAAFRFDEVVVPQDHVVGGSGEGRSRAMAKISGLRRAIAASCVGTAAWVLDEVVAEALRRNRRDGTKGDLDSVRLRFGEMRIQAYAARSMVYRTARLADAGANVVNETIAAKVFAAEVANQIVDGAVQLVGGEALVVGHPLEAALRRLRSLRLAEGESDTLRVNVSRGFLELGKGRI